MPFVYLMLSLPHASLLLGYILNTCSENTDCLAYLQKRLNISFIQITKNWDPLYYQHPRAMVALKKEQGRLFIVYPNIIVSILKNYFIKRDEIAELRQEKRFIHPSS